MSDIMDLCPEKVLPEPNSGCWLWVGSSYPNGYGLLQVGNSVRRRTNILAHRLSWEMSNNGPVPDGLQVLHKCDNKPCVNPDHLFVGTQHDNMQDMLAKGRAVKSCPKTTGTKNWSCKLTEYQVLHIRKSKDTNANLARKYGVSQNNIRCIKTHATWKHLP